VNTEVLPVEASNPDPAVIRRAAEVLRAGGLVAFPTETVYGLGANALDDRAVRRIYAVKGRPASNPIIVHVAGVPVARQLASDWPSAAETLATTFWPGPLTLVVPRAAVVPDVVAAGGQTVAIRCPAHAVAAALLGVTCFPLAAPSANASSRVSPTRAEHVLKDLAGKVELVLDAGPVSGGVESTVIDVTRDPPAILRPGLVTAEDIELALNSMVAQAGIAAEHGEPERSPGRMQRHYSPRIPLELARGGGWNRVQALLRSGLRVGWMSQDATNQKGLPGLIVVSMPGDAVRYAAQLYAALHELEDAGVERIVVDAPPESVAWRAVLDRLTRAASA
jgi:L-threonylcarbamoyladenylate synthase